MTPLEVYIRLKSHGAAETLVGGDAFWTKSEAELDAIAADWLVSEFAFEDDWPNWEMHPAGDEIVYLLAGEATLLMEQADRVAAVPMKAPSMVVVPQGVWHTATVSVPCRMLHITRGEGTRHRPVAPEDRQRFDEEKT